VIFKTAIPRFSQYVAIFPPLSDRTLKDESATVLTWDRDLFVKPLGGRYHLGFLNVFVPQYKFVH
jgi:hypothetical protein